jgi:hypothetical protein
MLKEEHRLRVLRNVLGPKREELTGDKGRWVGCVCVWKEVHTGFWWGK